MKRNAYLKVSQVAEMSIWGWLSCATVNIWRIAQLCHMSLWGGLTVLQ